MSFLEKMQELLKGKKTYIVSILFAIYGLAKVFGWIDFTTEQEAALFIFFGSLFGVAIRAGMNSGK